MLRDVRMAAREAVAARSPELAMCCPVLSYSSSGRVATLLFLAVSCLLRRLEESRHRFALFEIPDSYNDEQTRFPSKSAHS